MFRSYDHLQVENIYVGNYTTDNGSIVFDINVMDDTIDRF
jgi:hypothetical protein